MNKWIAYTYCINVAIGILAHLFVGTVLPPRKMAALSINIML